MNCADDSQSVKLTQLFNQKDFPDDAFRMDRVFSGKRLIAYGAGESFHYLKEIVIRKYGYVPVQILDRKFKKGDRYEGIPACSPEDYIPAEDDKKNALVVVCLGKQKYLEDVVRLLSRMGFRNIIKVMDIYEIHNPFNLPEELQAEGFSYYLRHKKQILGAMNLFEDDLSRYVFACCMRTHMTRKPVSIPSSPRNEQYTPKGLRLSKGHSRFIFCGVSAGEMDRVMGDIGPVDELVCFEPDPNQFAVVAEYLSKNHHKAAKRVTAIPCAVYSHESVEAFTYSDTSFGSRISASGQHRVQCITIDHVLPGFHPTFISMDIEGAELDALKGAGNTIRESHPDLAICLYHSPSHLWEIPLFIQSLEPDYKFHLRNYTSFVSETVLYASL